MEVRRAASADVVSANGVGSGVRRDGVCRTGRREVRPVKGLGFRF